MKKQPIFGVLFTLTLSLIVIIGSSYAYYTSNVDYVSGEASASFNSAELKIDYVDGPQLILNNMLPGAVLVKTFNVTNIGNVTSYYDVKLIDIINELTLNDDLVYSITSNNSGGALGDSNFPTSDVVVLSNVSIAANTTQEYTLTIRYINQPFDQSVDMNKHVFGTINVVKHS